MGFWSWRVVVVLVLSSYLPCPRAQGWLYCHLPPHLHWSCRKPWAHSPRSRRKTHQVKFLLRNKKTKDTIISLSQREKKRENLPNTMPWSPKHHVADSKTHHWKWAKPRKLHPLSHPPAPPRKEKKKTQARSENKQRKTKETSGDANIGIHTESRKQREGRRGSAFLQWGMCYWCRRWACKSSLQLRHPLLRTWWNEKCSWLLLF